MLKKSCFVFLIFAGFILFQSSVPKLIGESSFFLSDLIYRLIALCMAIYLLMIFHGIGALVCRLTGLVFESNIIRFITRCFTGCLFGGFLVYFLGFTGSMNVFVFQVVGIIAVLLSVYYIDYKNTFRLEWTNKYMWFISGSFVLLVLLRFFGALEFKKFGDPLFYSLPVGLDYLKLGGFDWVPSGEFYFQAGLADLNLIFLHALSSEKLLVHLAAQHFYATCSIFFLLALSLSFFSRFVPKSHAIALALAFSFPGIFFRISHYAKPDLMLAVIGVYTMIQLWDMLLSEDKSLLRRHALAIFLMSCLAVNIKLTALFFIPPIYATTIIVLFSRKALNPLIAISSISLAILGLVNSVKNYIVFKNPILPSGSSSFPSPYFSNNFSEASKYQFYFGEGNIFDYLLSLLVMSRDFLAVYLLTALFIYLCIRFKVKIFPIKKTNIKIVSLVVFTIAVFSIILWMQAVVGPGSPPRFLAGSIYIFAFFVFTAYALLLFKLKNKPLATFLKRAGITIVILTWVNSQADVDLLNIRRGWTSDLPRHQSPREISETEDILAYLNNKQFTGKLISNATSNRYYADFDVQVAREFSRTTGFLFGEDVGELVPRLKQFGADYLFLEKKKNLPAMLDPDKVNAVLTLEKTIGIYYLYRVD